MTSKRIIPINRNIFGQNSESRELSRQQRLKTGFHCTNMKCYSDETMIRRLSDTDLNGTSDTGAFWNNVTLSSNVPSTRAWDNVASDRTNIPRIHHPYDSLVPLLSVFYRINLYTMYDIYSRDREREGRERERKRERGRNRVVNKL